MSILDRLKKSSDAKKEKADAAKNAAGKQGAQEKGATAEKKSAKKADSKKAAPVNTAAGAYAGVLIQPLITEKATMTGTYYFAVAPNATKPQIAKAIEAVYGVKPASVRTMNVAGKAVRWNWRKGQRKDWKKAIVRLPEGASINVYQEA